MTSCVSAWGCHVTGNSQHASFPKWIPYCQDGGFLFLKIFDRWRRLPRMLEFSSPESHISRRQSSFHIGVVFQRRVFVVSSVAGEKATSTCDSFFSAVLAYSSQRQSFHSVWHRRTPKERPCLTVLQIWVQLYFETTRWRVRLWKRWWRQSCRERCAFFTYRHSRVSQSCQHGDTEGGARCFCCSPKWYWLYSA